MRRRSASGPYVPDETGLTRGVGPVLARGYMASRSALRRRRPAGRLTQPGGGGDDWPSETLLPGTRTVMVDEGFASLGVNNALPDGPHGNSWSYDGVWTAGTYLSHVVDPSAPGSPNYIRFTYPGESSPGADDGFLGGSGAGRAVNGENNFAGSNNYYIGLKIRWSAGWQGHTSGVNKYGYCSEKSNPGAISSFILNRRGNLLDVQLQYGQNYAGQCPSPDTQRNVPAAGCSESYVNSTSVEDGAWHTVENLINRSTGGAANGRWRVFVDGLLQWDVTNCRFAPTGDALMFGINLDMVWGGGEDQRVITTQTIDLSHVRCVGSDG